MVTSVTTSLASSLNDRLRRGKLQLPPLPGAAVQLMELAQKTNVDAAQLSQVIHQDQALAGRVLQVANTGSFRGVSEIVSLQQAVARLGSNLITELACAASLQSAFRSPAHAERMAQCGRYSIATALFAKEVARAGRRNVELAFLCGLMHNLGEATVLYIVGKRKGIAPEALDLCIEELRSEAGLAVAQTWRLPEPVKAAICSYPRPEHAPEAMAEPVATASLARYLTERLFEPEGCVPTSEAPGLDILNLYPDELEAVLDEGERIREAVAAMEAG